MLPSSAVKLFAAIVLSCLSLADLGCQKTRPTTRATSELRPPLQTPAVDPVPNSSDAPALTTDSLWLSVIANEATWILPNEFAGDGLPDSSVEIKVRNRRQLHGTVIAELEGRYILDGDSDPPYSVGIPTLIVADGRHAAFHYFGSEQMTDEELVKDLAENWAYEDPPTEFLRYNDAGSTLLEIRKHEFGLVYCIGEGPPDDEDFMCDDTCFATLCFSKRDGIVMLDGTWAPEDMRFSQPTYVGGKLH